MSRLSSAASAWSPRADAMMVWGRAGGDGAEDSDDEAARHGVAEPADEAKVFSAEQSMTLTNLILQRLQKEMGSRTGEDAESAIGGAERGRATESAAGGGTPISLVGGLSLHLLDGGRCDGMLSERSMSAATTAEGHHADVGGAPGLEGSCPSSTTALSRPHSFDSGSLPPEPAALPPTTSPAAPAAEMSEAPEELDGDRPAPVVSLGSHGHPEACGEACKYASRNRGCKDGAACVRCHLCKWSRPSTCKTRRRRVSSSSGMETTLCAEANACPPAVVLRVADFLPAMSAALVTAGG